MPDGVDLFDAVRERSELSTRRQTSVSMGPAVRSYLRLQHVAESDRAPRRQEDSPSPVDTPARAGGRPSEATSQDRSAGSPKKVRHRGKPFTSTWVSGR